MDFDEFMEDVMRTCAKALEEKGYDINGFSLGYEKFNVLNEEYNITVDFSE